MLRKLMRIGNSARITLDKKMLRDLGMDGTTYLWVEPNKNKKEIIIRKRKDSEW